MSADAARDSPPSASLEVRKVDVAVLDRELARLWAPTGSPGDKSERVVRACMSNLIVACASEEDERPLAGEVPRLAGRHPARVFVAVALEEREEFLEASVTGACALGEGGRKVCSEQVNLKAAGPAVARMAPIIRSLLVGDLPTALWWAGSEAPTQSGRRLFEDLSPMAGQIIYDSLGWSEPVGGIAAAARWLEGGQGKRVLADLAWRRLKPWRRLMAQSLAPETAPGILESLDEVRVDHGPHALTQAWLMIGWLASRLDWAPADGRVAAGKEVSWMFRTSGGPLTVKVRRLADADPGRVHGIVLSVRGSAVASFSALPSDRLGYRPVASDGPGLVVAATPPSRTELLARQLPDLARDPVFERALRICRSMADALLP